MSLVVKGLMMMMMMMTSDFTAFAPLTFANLFSKSQTFFVNQQTFVLHQPEDVWVNRYQRCRLRTKELLPLKVIWTAKTGLSTLVDFKYYSTEAGVCVKILCSDV